MNRASFVKQVPEFNGDARLYKLDVPLEGFEYVIVSAVVASFSGPETYIFGCNKHGNGIEWHELEGSFRGELDIEGALAKAGYMMSVGSEA